MIEALGPIRAIAAFWTLIQVSDRPAQFIGWSQSCLTEECLWITDALNLSSETSEDRASINESEGDRTKPSVHRLPSSKIDFVEFLAGIVRGSPRKQSCLDVLASIRLSLEHRFQDFYRLISRDDLGLFWCKLENVAS